MALARRKIRLLYVTYNENVLESGILFSQVRKMLAEVVSRGEVEYVRLLSFISPRLWLRCRRGYSHLKVELRDKGIDFRVRLMPAAQTWPWPAVPVMVVFCLPSVIMNLISGGYNMIHARGYGAGLLGRIAARITGRRMVFDPRGPFPEEMIVNGIWNEGCISYKLWKRVESILIRRSQAVVGVTAYMCKLHLQRGAERTIFVPNRADSEMFSAPVNPDSKGRPPILLFTGEMDTAWYRPGLIADHFLRIKEVVPEIKLKLVARRGIENIEREFAAAGVEDDDWQIESVQPDKVPDCIAGSDFGLILGIAPKFPGPQNWPVKLAEYLLMGVPLVVERTAGEHLTGLVRRWRLGMVVDKGDPASYQPAAEILRHRTEYAIRCQKFARLKLDLSHTARQYTRLYRQLLGN